jgi:hypothetical protein
LRLFSRIENKLFGARQRWFIGIHIIYGIAAGCIWCTK